jgi:hypothetical protein
MLEGEPSRGLEGGREARDCVEFRSDRRSNCPHELVPNGKNGQNDQNDQNDPNDARWSNFF